ncbi:ion channel protein [Demequina aurantiaca]|uniref:ion channel protein n=1 Tax=Demequina aurantiaca TaxID=676200 RepID=UPI003D342FBA
MTPEIDVAPRPSQLAKLAIPAIVIGVLSGVLLWGVEGVAEILEHGIWVSLPDAIGASADSAWWIIGTLTLTGLAVGLVIRYSPGHGGQDSATVELIGPVLPMRAVPGVAAVLILALAGGVSLGPENPIIALTIALSVALAKRFVPKVPTPYILMMAAAGILGAMFGTPIAAALLLTEMVAAAKRGGMLWDRLFGPVVAAGFGALVAKSLGVALMGDGLGSVYEGPNFEQVLIGTPIALVAALVGIAGAWAMPRLWRLFRRLRNPVLYVTAGGLVLGLLGAIGGPITLFKGSTQTTDLISQADTMTTWQILATALIKIAALTVAAAVGFRGGRIFPSVFIGVAIGLTAQSLFPSIDTPIALACGVLGAVLAVGRNGWLALFIAVAIGGDIEILTVMCVIILPTWLLVTGAPHMLVRDKDDLALAEREPFL